MTTRAPADAACGTALPPSATGTRPCGSPAPSAGPAAQPATSRPLRTCAARPLAQRVATALTAAMRAATAAAAAAAVAVAVPSRPAAAAAMAVAVAMAVPGPSWAASPAPAASADAQSQPARHLGRLFSTPQERALLDARRDGSVIESQPAAPATAALPAAPPAPLLLNGVVQRSNGATTVWLNDAPLAERDGKVLPDRSVSLRLPSGKRVTLKPGQSYDEATGAIVNAGE